MPYTSEVSLNVVEEHKNATSDCENGTEEKVGCGIRD